uniref:Uncharacterized protein n=1 Tax=Vespula pensylvanica TaxID=30213 RepID=A0A834P5P1_VESPE|nr:hypothetical protein H0235_005799 [Vespula pensylvanica]
MVAGFAIFMKYRYPKNLVGCSRSDTIWFLDSALEIVLAPYGCNLFFGWLSLVECRLTQSATVCDEERSVNKVAVAIANRAKCPPNLYALSINNEGKAGNRKVLQHGSRSYARAILNKQRQSQHSPVVSTKRFVS